ncbi:M48 family metalloprotease [Plastoroseomonas hellenica]|uniref:M48 family metalloprotease n=1 Tax=Plastoroseomonas hellenica TaxID=2687306 RepID=UPI001BAC3EE3|nr:M48 family metalloprotease [Plastoroseomonas hellenica]
MSNPEGARSRRATLGLLLITVLLPLAFLGLGLWEWQRGSADLEARALQRDRMAKVVATLEAWPAAANGSPDAGARFRRDGRTYAGPLALSQAKEALDDAEDTLALARFRRYLPPVLILCAALAAGLSILALLGAALLGRTGRRSREALVRGFGFVRHALPPLLGLQVLLAAIVIVAAVAFEASAILQAGALTTDGVKLLAIAAVVVGASLWTAGKALMQLRRTVGIFTPDPLPVPGRAVSAEEAPGLWRLLDDLAARLGALRPDNVVVGLTGGVFVSSGPKVLEPGGGAIGGRTLYLPLPLLPLLREDEVATIIGHELAHFSGGDTEYSLRFLPIYAGVGRSLDAVLLAGAQHDGSVSLLTRPALRLGVFVMDQFHLAVMHWSRLREFAADAAGAEVTSADAAARALLRVTAAQPRIDEALETAYRAPDDAPRDLVAAALGHAAERGLDSAADHLEERQAHPTDTHPTTRQRLDALGRAATPALLAEAAAAPAQEALSRLSAYFADPGALCREASDDFLEAARQHAEATRAALEATAAGIGTEAVALHENTRGGGFTLIGFGGALALVALVLVAIGLPATEGREAWIAIAGAGGVGLVFIVFGIGMLRRGDTPFLVLGPEAMAVAGLDRPIAWEHVLELDMSMDKGRVVTRLRLPPEAPFPARLPGGRRVKLDPKRRAVTFAAGPPRGLKAQGFAELVWRYRAAAAARALLAREASAAVFE